jgi:hypothetical protein
MYTNPMIRERERRVVDLTARVAVLEDARTREGERLHAPEPDAFSLTVTLRVATPTAWASVRVSEQRLRHNGLSAVLDGYREALAEARRRGPSPLPGPG